MATVLTDGQGLTLYYRTADTATSVTCTGGCAAAWPPVLLPAGTPTGSSAVTGTLTVFAGPNGSQVLYNGHPLYRWAKDTAAGQATGQGIGGFLVATPGLAA
jgi:predicted lipoprotein with Yx(FWY)xxD motif